MRLIIMTVALCAIAMPQIPLLAQNTSNNTVIHNNNSDLNRAKNLARQAAERANGGLGQYRAEASMHGPAEHSPFVDNGNGSWTFTFFGSRPGFSNFSIESVVTVAQDGKKVTFDYNGPIRKR